MSYDYVIDSYAWVEYFRGTSAGEVARPYLESDRAATSSLTLGELREKYLRQEWDWFERDLAFIVNRTQVIPLDRELAVMSGELNHARKKVVRDWGMADSVVLATAQSASAKVVTGDAHFRDLPIAIMIN